VAVVIGNAPPYETMPIFPGMLTLTGKSLVGSCFGSTVPRRDVPRLVEWWRRGVLRPGELVSRRAPLEEIDDALARFARESGLRTVIVP
jgi:Zn-dependent alcohol dehydrogenase